MCCATWCPDMVCCDDSVTVKTSWKLNTMSCCHAPWFEIWWDVMMWHATIHDGMGHGMWNMIWHARIWYVRYPGMLATMSRQQQQLQIWQAGVLCQLQKEHGTHRLDPFGNLDICWIQNLKRQGCQVSVCPCTPFSQLHLWDIHMPCEEKGHCSSPGSQKMPSTGKSCHASELATSSPSLSLCICASASLSISSWISTCFYIFLSFSIYKVYTPVLTSEASSFYICHSFRWKRWYL